MLSHQEVQQALSARIDGESTGADDAAVDAHVAHCEECSAYWDKALSLSRTLAFAEVDGGMAPPGDLSEVILAGVEPEWRRHARRRVISVAVGRVALVLIGVLLAVDAAFLVGASGGLVSTSADGDVLSADSQPELAALTLQSAAVGFGIALALFYCAWRPPHIPGVLLITGTTVAFTIGFTVRDWALTGTAYNLGESVLLLLACAALAWTWVADRGPELRRAWRLLNADPS